MFKIATWNVAGLYAAIKKDFCKSIKTLDIDVLCLQETKLSLKKPPPPEIAEQLKEWKYRTYANSEGKAGYSGTADGLQQEPVPQASSGKSSIYRQGLTVSRKPAWGYSWTYSQPSQLAQ